MKRFKNILLVCNFDEKQHMTVDRAAQSVGDPHPVVDQVSTLFHQGGQRPQLDTLRHQWPQRHRLDRPWPGWA